MEFNYSVLLALVAFSALSSSMAFAAQTQVVSQLQSAKPTPFPVCIDDSDCEKLGQGNKFACFQYICYPWKNDTFIAAKNRRKTCREDGDCDAGQECYRHHDKRVVNRGVCFDEIKTCQNANECSKGHECCGGNCCEEKYYKEFAKLPCISDMGCQDLGLGQYCCPQDQTKVCCNVNPNPPPPTTPYPLQAVGSSTVLTQNMAVSFLVAFVVAVH